VDCGCGGELVEFAERSPKTNKETKSLPTLFEFIIRELFFLFTKETKETIPLKKFFEFCIISFLVLYKETLPQSVFRRLQIKS